MIRLIQSSLAVVVLMASGFAQATIFNIIDVQSGTDGGFGYSSFHDSSGSDPMQLGPDGYLADVTAVLGGTYDDSGALDVTLELDSGAGTVHITGNLIFDGSGILGANSFLDLDFTGAGLDPALVDTTIWFVGADVCCSGSADPNSFTTDSNGDLVMSLWGANHDDETFSGTYLNSTIGMDLRLELQPVPVPAAVWLFGSGLLGLVGVARRRQQ